MIQLHYARARKHAFPYAEKNVAGPFEALEEAWNAVARLRPLYPDCEVFKRTENVGNKRGAFLLGGPKIEERVES